MYQIAPGMQKEPQKIVGHFAGKDIVSFDQFARADLYTVFEVADRMKRIAVHNQPSHLLEGLLIGLLFFEPSSRTFSSFAAAIKRLGGQAIEQQNPTSTSSVSKGESFEDTMQVMAAYTNAIVLRHPMVGSARQAARVTDVPIINAGDGNNEHPTQTLLDLYTIYEHFGRLDHLTGLLAGDALNSRTMHSLLRGLALFEGNTVYVLSPNQLRLSGDDLVTLRDRGLRIIEIQHERDIPRDCHFWYWTRVQKERFGTAEEYRQAQGEIVVATPDLLRRYASADMILMDPLPRVNSVDPAVDADPRAVYLRAQIRNGLYTRMALLGLVMDRV
jgi:aspartate carbamoyltransferase catalytic subunit